MYHYLFTGNIIWKDHSEDLLTSFSIKEPPKRHGLLQFTLDAQFAPSLVKVILLM